MANDEVFQSVTIKQIHGNVEMSNAAGPALVDSAASTTTPTVCANKADLTSGLGHTSGLNICLIAGGAEGARIEAPSTLGATETSLWLYDDDNGTLQQVTVGADDSGGAGFKLLRITN